MGYFYINTGVFLSFFFKSLNLMCTADVCPNGVPLNPRWYQATKTMAMASKVDSLKDERDEALAKMELCKVRRSIE